MEYFFWASFYSNIWSHWYSWMTLQMGQMSSAATTSMTSPRPSWRCRWRETSCRGRSSSAPGLGRFWTRASGEIRSLWRTVQDLETQTVEIQFWTYFFVWGQWSKDLVPTWVVLVLYTKLIYFWGGLLGNTSVEHFWFKSGRRARTSPSLVNLEPSVLIVLT